MHILVPTAHVLDTPAVRAVVVMAAPLAHVFAKVAAKELHPAKVVAYESSAVVEA